MEHDSSMSAVEASEVPQENNASDKPTQEQAVVSPVAAKQKNKMLVWAGLTMGILLLAGTAFGAYYVGKQSARPKVTSRPTTLPTSFPTSKPTPSPTPFSIPDAKTTATVTDAQGITWYEEPQPLRNIKLFNTVNGGDYAEIIYYKVGNDNGSDLILSLIQPNSPDYPSEAMFLKKSDTNYDLLVKLSPDLYTKGRYLGPEIVGMVTQNPEKTYPSLTEVPTLQVKGQTLKEGAGYNLFTEYQNDQYVFGTSHNGPNAQGVTVKMEEVASTPYGKVYSYTEKSGENHSYETNQFVLKRYNGTARAYQLFPSFYKDDSVPGITWNDGKKNKDTYRLDGTQGCGFRTAIAVLPDTTMSSLKSSGKTSTGEMVYEFTDANNETFKTYYAGVVGTGSTYTDYSTSPPKEIQLSAQEYLSRHGVFVYKDKLNRLLVFVNTVMAAAAECGKPVVYLYPTQKTDVSVKVDAKITVSEPEYSNGWNVTALPDGTLTNHKDGKTYDSLFWEGLGNGAYPPVTSGFVVPQAELQATLQNHLAKLGLNQKESSDFMEFWLPKMPKTPYVRLTWFGTRQMDGLAPLTITPKPDSVIRIFLDFEGLQQPINLPPQRLGAIPRKGFTVVEWGGLLRK